MSKKVGKQNQTDIIFKQLIPLIKQLNITHIFSYDDNWINNKSNHLEEKYDMDFVEFIQRNSISLNTEEETIISNNGYITLEEILNNTSIELDRIRQEVIEKGDFTREDKVLITLDNLLENLGGNNICINRISEKFKKEDVEEIEGKILFLLDMNMENNKTSDTDVIIESILNIKEVRPDYLDIAIVYSHESLEVYKNERSKADYVNEYLMKNQSVSKTTGNNKELETNEIEKYLLLHQLWAFNKTTDLEKLSEDLITTLTRAAFGYSLHDYLKLKVTNLENSMLEVIKLNEEVFDSLYTDSFIEGELFPEILNRTQNSILNKIEHQYLSETKNHEVIKNLLNVSKLKNNKIIENIEKIENKNNNVTKFREKVNSNKATESIYKGISEHGLVEYSINNNFKNISSGDIFEIFLHGTKNRKYGILITPECDLMVRFSKNISSIDRNCQLATLLLYEEVELKLDTILKDLIWPIKIDDKFIGLKKKAEVFNVDINVLDLCCLNDKGQASLLVDYEKASIYKTYHYEEFYKQKLKSWIDSIVNFKTYIDEDLLKNITVLEDVKDEEENTLLNTFIGLKYNICFSKKENKFALKRIGRLEIRRTMELSQKNNNLLSRIAVPGNPLA